MFNNNLALSRSSSSNSCLSPEDLLIDNYEALNFYQALLLNDIDLPKMRSDSVLSVENEQLRSPPVHSNVNLAHAIPISYDPNKPQTIKDLKKLEQAGVELSEEHKAKLKNHRQTVTKNERNRRARNRSEIADLRAKKHLKIELNSDEEAKLKIADQRKKHKSDYDRNLNSKPSTSGTKEPLGDFPPLYKNPEAIAEYKEPNPKLLDYDPNKPQTIKDLKELERAGVKLSEEHKDKLKNYQQRTIKNERKRRAKNRDEIANIKAKQHLNIQLSPQEEERLRLDDEKKKKQKVRDLRRQLKQTTTTSRPQTYIPELNPATDLSQLMLQEYQQKFSGK